MDLTRDLEDLFRAQISAWPMLRAGIDALRQVRRKKIATPWFEIEARHLPHRMASATARVDAASVSQRPCFLCASNLPREERGILFDRDFAIYCNPYPILERHVTIVHASHQPQRITGHVDSMLGLAAALPGYFVLYNGAECGASAPDHLHFQAARRSVFPIGGSGARIDGLGIRIEGTERANVTMRVEALIESLSQVMQKTPEPLLNLAVFCENDSWTVFLFPRARHRPACFHSGELTLSPGAIDLCGILVVPVEEDFENLSSGVVTAVFEEVLLLRAAFEKLSPSPSGRGCPKGG